MGARGIFGMSAMRTYSHWAVRPGRSSLLWMLFWSLTLAHLSHQPMSRPQESWHLHLAMHQAGQKSPHFSDRNKQKVAAQEASKEYPRWQVLFVYTLLRSGSQMCLLLPDSFLQNNERKAVSNQSLTPSVGFECLRYYWGEAISVGHQWRHLQALTICMLKEIGSHTMRPTDECKRRYARQGNSLEG